MRFRFRSRAEKYFDIVMQQSGITPRPPSRHHGPEHAQPGEGDFERGLSNLGKHIKSSKLRRANYRRINRFPMTPPPI